MSPARVKAKRPPAKPASKKAKQRRAAAQTRVQERAELYFGIPQGFQVRVTMREGTRPLDRLGRSAFAWGKPRTLSPGEGVCAALLARAILEDALGDGKEADALHKRFQFRTISGFDRDQPWSLTRAQVLDIVAEIRAVEHDRVIRQQLKTVALEAPPAEHESGRGIERPIKWDTDDDGRRIPERED